MARSTANNNRKPPKGMQRFEVIDATIRDSLGQYCVAGDFAILTRDAAQSYLDRNMIKVALPDFDDEDDEEGKDVTEGKVEDEDEEEGEGEEDGEGDDPSADDAGAENATERTKAPAAVSKSSRKRGARAAVKRN